MSDIRKLLWALEGLLGRNTVAPMKFHYERARADGKVLLPPPSSEVANGEFQLGKVIWNDSPRCDFGLREKELPQHIFIAGRSGSGKTNLALNLLRQLYLNRKKILIFDWKQNYRVIAPSLDTTLFTPGYSEAPISFNPLDLSSIPTQLHQAYIRHLVSVILDSYFRELRLLTTEGVEGLLLRAIDAIRNEKRIFTFRDVETWLYQMKTVGREADWKTSLQNVLRKMNTGPIGQVMNPKLGIPTLSVPSLLKQRTLIELHWLGSPKDKSFLMQILLLGLYYHVSRLGSTSRLRLFILVEESHNISLKHAHGFETVMEMVLRQVREYGISMCLVDQHPSLISIPARGTYTTIALSLATHEDIRAVADAMALGSDAEFLGKLRVGQAIVKLRDRYLNPFLLQIPNANAMPKIRRLHPSIYTEYPRIKEIVESLASQRVRVVPAKPSYPSSKSDSYSPTTEVIPKENTEREVFPRVPKRNLRFLVDVGEYPITITSHRYLRLRLSPKQGNQIRSELQKANMVRPVDINTGRARVRLLEVTGVGEQLLRDNGYETKGSGKRGSLEHQYWCEQANKYFEEKGYKVLGEVDIGGGKAVDLVAMKGNEKVAIEVETGKSDVVGNVRKCLEADFSKVVLVAISREVKKRIEKKLQNHGIIPEIDVVVLQ